MNKIIIAIILSFVIIAVFGALMNYSGVISFVPLFLPMFSSVFTVFLSWLSSVVNTFSAFYYVNFVLMLFLFFFLMGSLIYYLIRGGKK